MGTRTRIGLVAAIALGLDQLTKLIARAEIAPGERSEFILGIDFVRVANDGIAFGLFDDAGAAVTVISAIAFLALLALVARTSHSGWTWLPMGLLAGGAIGNLLDRLRLGAVTDFIDLPRWPAFNLADVWITLGVIVLAVTLLREPEPDDG